MYVFFVNKFLALIKLSFFDITSNDSIWSCTLRISNNNILYNSLSSIYSWSCLILTWLGLLSLWHLEQQLIQFSHLVSTLLQPSMAHLLMMLHSSTPYCCHLLPLPLSPPSSFTSLFVVFIFIYTSPKLKMQK